MTFESLEKRLEHYNQQHVLRFWGELSADQQRSLARETEQLDLSQLAALTKSGGPIGESRADKALRAVPPAQLVRSPGNSNRDRQAWAAARQTGEDVLKAGRIGVILVAGGEGSRLGFPHPKGQFPI